MDPQKLASLVVREVNDEIAVREFGHGFLMVLPLTYWDDDRITLFIEPFENGFRVTDRGATAVRLHMTGMNLDSAKVSEAWQRSVAILNLVNPGDEELELAHFTEVSGLGEAILKVAEASLRVDRLRWLRSAGEDAAVVTPTPRGVMARLPLPDGVGQVRHLRGGFRADRFEGHAARVHAFEQADSGAEQHG